MRTCRRGHPREKNKVCVECRKILKANWKSKNPVRYASHQKNYRSRNPVRDIWRGMMRRCFDEKKDNYANYGGRGITVCKRWSGPHGYTNFVTDMGERPSQKHTLERRNNNRNYMPSNCYWATYIEQGNNRRDSYFLRFRGKSMTVTQWSREVGISAMTIRHRILKRGWSIKDALTLPVYSRSSRWQSNG